MQSVISSALSKNAKNVLNTNDLKSNSYIKHKKDDEKMMEVEYNAAQDALYKSMALNITCESPKLMSDLDQRRMISMFGTETTVSLPSGHKVSMVALSQQKINMPSTIG